MMPHLTPGDVLVTFGQSVTQYFTCSLIAMWVPEHGAGDMPGYFERSRHVIMAAFACLYLVAGACNYVYPQPNGLPVSAGCRKTPSSWSAV